MNALWDADFWASVRDQVNAAPRNLQDALASYAAIPEQADAIAEQTFPGSARDASVKNAFRHALGTGMLTQRLGGGPVAAGVAKAIGYGWEGMGLLDGSVKRPAWREDSLHDLNANAIGARTAQGVQDLPGLVQALKAMALQSAPVAPPGVFEPSPGYLTRSAQ